MFLAGSVGDSRMANADPASSAASAKGPTRRSVPSRRECELPVFGYGAARRSSGPEARRSRMSTRKSVSVWRARLPRSPLRLAAVCSSYGSASQYRFRAAQKPICSYSGSREYSTLTITKAANAAAMQSPISSIYSASLRCGNRFSSYIRIRFRAFPSKCRGAERVYAKPSPAAPSPWRCSP